MVRIHGGEQNSSFMEDKVKRIVYQDATLKSLGNNPFGTREDVIYLSMDIYAEQVAIDFCEWVELNGYRLKGMDDGQRKVIYDKYKSEKAIIPPLSS